LDRCLSVVLPLGKAAGGGSWGRGGEGGRAGGAGTADWGSGGWRGQAAGRRRGWRGQRGRELDPAAAVAAWREVVAGMKWRRRGNR